jgi:hypothetical protein
VIIGLSIAVAYILLNVAGVMWFQNAIREDGE